MWTDNTFTSEMGEQDDANYSNGRNRGINMNPRTTSLGALLATLSALASMSSSPALAGSATGQVTMVLASHDVPGGVGLSYVQLSGGADYSGRPGCNTQHRFAVNPAWPGGKEAIAVALLALHSGKTVGIVGQGSCSLWPDSETLGYIQEY
jgi:hypothetical protein